MKTLTTHSLAFVACAALASPAFAQPASDSEYTCKEPGEVSQSFKAETDLKDLLTWTMSFTCKNMTLDPRIVYRGKPLTPDTITALWRRPPASARTHHVVLTATKPSASEPMTFQISVKR